MLIYLHNSLSKNIIIKSSDTINIAKMTHVSVNFDFLAQTTRSFFGISRNHSTKIIAEVYGLNRFSYDKEPEKLKAALTTLDSFTGIKGKTNDYNHYWISQYSFNKKGLLKYSLINKIMFISQSIHHIFQNIFISNPTYKVSKNAVIIQIYYYIHPKDSSDLSYLNMIHKLEALILNKIKLNIRLHLIKINYPFLNSDILSKYITCISTDKMSPNLYYSYIKDNKDRQSPSKSRRHKLEHLFNKIPLLKATTTLNAILSKYVDDKTVSVRNSFRKVNTLKDRPQFAMKNDPFLHETFSKNSLNQEQLNVLLNYFQYYKLKSVALTGIRYDITGRLTKRRTASRSAVTSRQKGSFKLNSTQFKLQKSKVYYKNKNGAFSVKIYLSSSSE